MLLFESIFAQAKGKKQNIWHAKNIYKNYKKAAFWLSKLFEKSIARSNLQFEVSSFAGSFKPKTF